MSAHWVIFACFAWGHLRPESNLAANLARKFPSVTISIVVDADFASKSLAEIRRNASLGGDESIMKRIRVIGLCRILEKFTPEMAASYSMLDPRIAPHTPPDHVERLHAFFDVMMEEKEFEDDAGRIWTAVPKPNLIIADMMTGAFTPALKRKYKLPLCMWYVGCAGSFTRYYGPNELGGRGPGFVEECLAIEANPDRANGRSYSRIAQDLWAAWPRTKDDIIRVKGWPPLYAWEDSPQMTWMPSFYDSVAVGMDLVNSADAIMLPTVLDIVSLFGVIQMEWKPLPLSLIWPSSVSESWANGEAAANTNGMGSFSASNL